MMTRTLLAGVAAGAVAVSASAANLAPLGVAGLGYAPDTATNATLRNHIGAGVQDDAAANTRLTDGDTSVNAGVTTVDTWAGGGTLAQEVAQVLFPGQVANGVDQITISMVTFRDGGWFGTNGSNTKGADLVVPTVQVTSDGGTTWVDVVATTDYVAVQDAVAVVAPGPATEAATATFDFAAQNGIDGIRLVGTAGGTASGGTAGFIGATEITVNGTEVVPEPTSLALLGLGGLLIARRRRG